VYIRQMHFRTITTWRFYSLIDTVDAMAQQTTTKEQEGVAR